MTQAERLRHTGFYLEKIITGMQSLLRGAFLSAVNAVKNQKPIGEVRHTDCTIATAFPPSCHGFHSLSKPWAAMLLS